MKNRRCIVHVGLASLAQLSLVTVYTSLALVSTSTVNPCFQIAELPATMFNPS